jgi:hypothetical protein
MKMALLLVLGICVAPIIRAQQVEAPIVDLKAATKVELLTTLRSPWRGMAVCDAPGNVYMRLLASEGPGTQERAAVPIRKITADGKLVGSFRILDAFPDDVTGNGVDLLGRGVFVTPDSRVFQTADVHGNTFVVEFAQDGSVKAKTKLAAADLAQAWTWRFAVFKSGEYLVTASTGKDHVVPFTGVFAADGRLVKRIFEPEDEENHQKSSPTDWNPHSIDEMRSIDFVRFGDATAASDGNMYLLHGTNSPALVYVISAAGDVVRKLRIDAGDSDLAARSLKSYGERLAIQFYKWVDTDSQQSLIKVTDLEGNSIANYRMKPVEGNRSLYLAGYGSDGFTFVPYHSEDKLYLVEAKLPRL